MALHVTPDTEKRLEALAAKTGRAPEELLEDAIPYLEELASVRQMLELDTPFILRPASISTKSGNSLPLTPRRGRSRDR